MLKSFGIGSAPALHGVPGAAENAIPVKPITRFNERWLALLARVQQHPGTTTVEVVGAEAGGVELLRAMQFRLRSALRTLGRNPDELVFHLFTDRADILPTHNARVRRRFDAVLAARQVGVHRNAAVTQVMPGRLQTASGEVIEAGESAFERAGPRTQTLSPAASLARADQHRRPIRGATHGRRSIAGDFGHRHALRRLRRQEVGSTVLSRALSQLHPVQRDDVLIGLSDPDDAAVVRVPAGKALVHSVDFFRSFIDDTYLIGKVEDVLFQMMTGALEVLNEANCALVGGHTGEGKELALGFAINGLIDDDPAKILRKNSMRAGDVLILTKPIGTGTLSPA